MGWRTLWAGRRELGRRTLRGDMGIIRFLYGELSHEALVQASFFSALLCFIVGVYWMMRSLKDSVFASVVGLEYQPQAKMFSLVVVSVVLVAYNKIVDIVPRHRLFAVICGAYSTLFVATAVMLTSTTHGLVGPDGQPIPPSPERWLGWIHYFAIESYGSLVVSLFWQYLNSQVNLKEATARPPATSCRRVATADSDPPTRCRPRASTASSPPAAKRATPHRAALNPWPHRTPTTPPLWSDRRHHRLHLGGGLEAVRRPAALRRRSSLLWELLPPPPRPRVPASPPPVALDVTCRRHSLAQVG